MPNSICPVNLQHRDFKAEAIPDDGGLIVFEQDAAQEINRARIAHINSLGLELSKSRVLDVGCGVGHFTRYYTELECQVVGVDGRPDNIAAMRKLYTGIEGHVMDVQVDRLARLGDFDLVHCYGLLYHLESPIAALRNIESVCARLLILETIICDSQSPILELVDEPKTVNQALAGIGCRPSPAYVVMALNRVGFAYVYAPVIPPDHADFRFEWRNDLASMRNGTNMRYIFVASRNALNNPTLVPLVKRG